MNVKVISRFFDVVEQRYVDPCEVYDLDNAEVARLVDARCVVISSRQELESTERKDKKKKK